MRVCSTTTILILFYAYIYLIFLGNIFWVYHARIIVFYQFLNVFSSVKSLADMAKKTQRTLSFSANVLIDCLVSKQKEQV
jgi:hypothetical protein